MSEPLIVGVFAVDIDRRDAFPRPVAGEAHVVVVRRRRSRAVAPVPDADVVAKENVPAIDADERPVHLGARKGLVAPRPKVGESASLHLGHHHVVERLASDLPVAVGIERRVHTIQRVCHLFGPAVHNAWSRPRAHLPTVVDRLDVELHYGAVGLRRNLDAVHAVARSAVGVGAVVEHRKNGILVGIECRVVASVDKLGAVDTISQIHRRAEWRFVNRRRRDGHRIDRSRNHGTMLHSCNQRRHVIGRDGVGMTRRAADVQTGGPVRAVFVGPSRIDQFQRLAAAIVIVAPLPATMAPVDRAQLTDAPVSAVRIRDLVD